MPSRRLPETWTTAAAGLRSSEATQGDKAKRPPLGRFRDLHVKRGILRRLNQLRHRLVPEHRRDVRWYVQQLEETMIRATADFTVTAARIPDRHGIWLQSAAGEEEKLAALGVHLSRWVTSHGFAYNVATDLRYFDLIVPCGIAGKRATSLERVLDRAVRTDEVRPRLAAHFGELFERDMISVSRADLEENLQHRVQHALAPRPSEVLELRGSMA